MKNELLDKGIITPSGEISKDKFSGVGKKTGTGKGRRFDGAATFFGVVDKLEFLAKSNFIINTSSINSNGRYKFSKFHVLL